MNTSDHTLYSDLLNLEVDGALTGEQQARLEEHLAVCAECRAERSRLRGLADLLGSSRLPVEPAFRERVMEALPAAGWEARHPRTWVWPAAICAGLLAAGVALLDLGSLGSAYGLFAALAGMLRATLVAGIGFTSASWRWCGMFVRQLLDSPLSMAMFGILILSLNLLLVSLVRRRRTAPAAAAPDRSGRARRPNLPG